MKGNHLVAMLVVVVLSLANVSVTQARPDVCPKSKAPTSTLGSAITGTGSGVTISLHETKTSDRIGHFKFAGELWFFDGGETTAVGDGIKLLELSVNDFQPANLENTVICAEEDHFLILSDKRRFKLSFPSAAFAAYVEEVKQVSKK